jgi:histidine triad (HIT) family protein
MGDCPFCERIRTGDFFGEGPAAASFEPLNPVTPGHRLYISRSHVEHAAEDPYVTAAVMQAAAFAARKVGDCNLITSVGPAATQTVRHLHIHLVPRTRLDGLSLPWTGQRREGPRG